MSLSLQQCVEEKIHSVTSELVKQLLALPNVTCVELTGHIGVTINRCFTFTVLPNPSSLLERCDSISCANIPGKDQHIVSDWDVELCQMKNEESATSEATACVSQTGLGKDSIQNKGTERVSKTGVGKDSLLQSEAPTKHVLDLETDLGEDSMIQSEAATESASETGLFEDSAETKAAEYGVILQSCKVFWCYIILIVFCSRPIIPCVKFRLPCPAM